ncbi:MAG: hypothetical protein LDL33_13510, partial [Desulfomonile sp.]|nr:hypothetical protein [Desulfomonile sp.]
LQRATSERRRRIEVAKSSDRIAGLLVGVGRSRERRFDGLASLEVKGPPDILEKSIGNYLWQLL